MKVLGTDEFTVIDVRDLVDKPGNNSAAVRAKIDEGVAALGSGKRTVVCCDYGISRSNAIAAGVLACAESLDFEVAVRKVMDATGEREIKLGPLAAVREALGDPSRKRSSALRNVLVTGSTGFIGQTLLSSELPNVNFVPVKRQEIDLVEGATALDLLINQHCADTVVHLANPRIYTSNRAFGETITILRNVIEACTANNVALIYLSGWEVYSGFAAQALFANEAVPAFPKGPYGQTKHHAEIMINHSRKTEGLDCAILRSSPLYGLGSDRPKFIFNFLDAAIRGNPIQTHRYRNGDPALDLMHVSDLVAALAAVIDTRYSGDFNLGTGVLSSTPEIARLIGELVGTEVQLQHRKIEADVANVALDSGMANRCLGWRPKRTLRDGLAEIVNGKLKEE